MAHISVQNDKYLKKRNTSLLKLYKSVIGAPKLSEMALIAILELLCLVADLTAFGQLFGQVMGDMMGMVAAAAVSLLFPLMTYLCFKGVAERFKGQKARERLSLALLIAMATFMLMSLVIRFPLEAAAASEDGADWLVGASVYCLPTLSSVLGAFSAALTLHNPQTESKVRTAKLRARISVVKAEIATLQGNDPQKLRDHLELIYRAAYCEVDGLMNCAIAESVSAIVARQGLAVHDHLGKLVGTPQSGTARYDSRPAEFAAQYTPALASASPQHELESPQDEQPLASAFSEQPQANNTVAN